MKLASGKECSIERLISVMLGVILYRRANAHNEYVKAMWTAADNPESDAFFSVSTAGL